MSTREVKMRRIQALQDSLTASKDVVEKKRLREHIKELMTNLGKQSLKIKQDSLNKINPKYPKLKFPDEQK